MSKAYLYEFIFIQPVAYFTLTYERYGHEHAFVEKVENSTVLSTAKSLRTQVFHKVVHIIHSFRGKRLWKKGEQMCFLWISEKPENSPFLFFRKIPGNL